jgi:hypothetical protein
VLLRHYLRRSFPLAAVARGKGWVAKPVGMAKRSRPFRDGKSSPDTSFKKKRRTK